MDEYTESRHVKEGAERARELSVSWQSFEINPISHSAPPPSIHLFKHAGLNKCCGAVMRPGNRFMLLRVKINSPACFAPRAHVPPGSGGWSAACRSVSRITESVTAKNLLSSWIHSTSNRGSVRHLFLFSAILPL